MKLKLLLTLISIIVGLLFLMTPLWEIGAGILLIAIIVWFVKKSK